MDKTVASEATDTVFESPRDLQLDGKACVGGQRSRKPWHLRV